MSRISISRVSMLGALVFVCASSFAALAEDGYTIGCYKASGAAHEFTYEFLDGQGNVVATHTEDTFQVAGASSSAIAGSSSYNAVGRGLTADQVKTWCLNKFVAHANSYIDAQFNANTAWRSAVWSLDGAAAYRYCVKNTGDAYFFCNLGYPQSKLVDPIHTEGTRNSPTNPINTPCGDCDPTGPLPRHNEN